MGKRYFEVRSTGATAKEAFDRAREDAIHMYGYQGGTGTIAEKETFNVISVGHGSIGDSDLECILRPLRTQGSVGQWSPAGCLKIGRNEYVFFGWAHHE